MLTFSEFQKFTDHELDEAVLDEAKLTRSSWAKSAAIILQARILNQVSRVKSAKSTDEKLDRLAEAMKTHSYLSTLAIATDLNDKSILKGKRK